MQLLRAVIVLALALGATSRAHAQEGPTDAAAPEAAPPSPDPSGAPTDPEREPPASREADGSESGSPSESDGPDGAAEHRAAEHRAAVDGTSGSGDAAASDATSGSSGRSESDDTSGSEPPPRGVPQPELDGAAELPDDEEPRESPPEAEGDDAGEEDGEAEFGIRATTELGFLAVLAHEIRLGSDGTNIDYVTDGNQSNLYLFLRLGVELDIWRQHHITLLYQPIDITTRTTLRRDLRIDGLDFPEGTPTRFDYRFPFFRFAWDFDVLEDPREQLRFGLGLQIRNATIDFESRDGTLYRGRADVGPVPLLRVAMRFPIDAGFFFAFEADGFYAPISVLNGSDTDVQGAILDTSLRFGWRFIDHLEAFVNVRYIGGGASGSGDPTPTSDGEQANWLHFLAVSLGATVDSRP